MSTIASPAYTREDVALLLALEQYESSLCRGCAQPREVAWHSDMDGFYEAETFVCHACTARNPDGQKAIYTLSVDTRPASKGPLPPFVLGQTTSSD